MNRLQAPGPRPQTSPRLTPTPRFAISVLTLAVLVLKSVPAQVPPVQPIRGLAQGPALARTYESILNADFDQAAEQMTDACETVPEWCAVLDAVSTWWQIALEPESQRYDADFSRAIENAINVTEAWTEREPTRAEAWFALGAAYGTRAQWRVERRERVGAARDGKNIKNALDQALALDPELHDAKFGIGMYRYYADVAPAALRMLRWFLLLPDGDREAGLQQMNDARERGTVLRGEADYQLHLIYLWYEDRAHDALALIRELQERHPRNPMFPLLEARIHDVYFHDAKTSAIVLRALIARAGSSDINAAALARRRAHAALTAIDTRTPR